MYIKIASKKRVGKSSFGTDLIHSPWGKVPPNPPARRFDLDETDRQPLIEDHEIRTAGKTEAEEAILLPDGAGVEPFAADALPGEPVHDGLQGGRFPASVGSRHVPPRWSRVEPFAV